MKPKVYHWTQDKLPTRVTYVGRPSPFGNPFQIGKDGSRLEVIQKFRDSLTPECRKEIREKLRGQNLACWCSPKPCHADVLIEIANEEGAA